MKVRHDDMAESATSSSGNIQPLRSIEDVVLRDGRRLTEVIDQHIAWMHTGGQDGKRATFYRKHARAVEDLTNIDFSEADLSLADFRGADISGSSFRKARLNQSNLLGVAARKADFTQAILEGANFTRSILTGSTFRGVDAMNACFYHAWATSTPAGGRTVLASSNFYGADFRGANLHDAIFTGSLLLEADFRMADLRGATLDSTKRLDACRFAAARIDNISIWESSGGLTLQDLQERTRRRFSSEFGEGVTSPVNAIAYELSNGGDTIRGRPELRAAFTREVIAEVKSFEDLVYLQDAQITRDLQRWFEANEMQRWLEAGGNDACETQPAGSPDHPPAEEAAVLEVSAEAATSPVHP